MEIIDIENWDRKEQYEVFRNLGIPFYSVTVELDVSLLYAYCKEQGLSFYHSMVYVSTAALNSVKEFLDKLRDGYIVRYDKLTPSFTYMRKNDLFGICNVEWQQGESLISFCDRCKLTEAAAKEGAAAPNEAEEERDDMAYISCTPWFSFTHVTQEMSLNPLESIPRVLWGKFFDRDGKKIMPISIQVNHMLIDGIHIAKWLSAMEKMIGDLS